MATETLYYNEGYQVFHDYSCTMMCREIHFDPINGSQNGMYLRDFDESLTTFKFVEGFPYDS